MRLSHHQRQGFGVVLGLYAKGVCTTGECLGQGDMGCVVDVAFVVECVAEKDSSHRIAKNGGRDGAVVFGVGGLQGDG